MLDKREGSIWLLKRINLFQKESIFLKKSAKHLNSLWIAFVEIEKD